MPTESSLEGLNLRAIFCTLAVAAFLYRLAKRITLRRVQWLKSYRSNKC